MDDPRAIGARIRQARTARALTQVDLAAAVGVSRAHLTNVEGGNGGLALDKLSLLARETGTTVAWLIGEAGPVDPAETSLLASFRSLDQRDRETALRILESLRRNDPPASSSLRSNGRNEPSRPPGGKTH